MQRTLAVIKGATPAQALAEFPGPRATARELVGGVPSVAPSEAAASGQPVGGSASGTTYYKPSSEGGEAGGMLLNYLLGN
jgi:hypothetical protein